MIPVKFQFRPYCSSEINLNPTHFLPLAMKAELKDSFSHQVSSHMSELKHLNEVLAHRLAKMPMTKEEQVFLKKELEDLKHRQNLLKLLVDYMEKGRQSIVANFR